MPTIDPKLDQIRRELETRRNETRDARRDRALRKLEEGRYGICDCCGEPIAPGRLQALPKSVLCLVCAKRGRAASHRAAGDSTTHHSMARIALCSPSGIVGGLASRPHV
jgi:hypothetical protein